MVRAEEVSLALPYDHDASVAVDYGTEGRSKQRQRACHAACSQRIRFLSRRFGFNGATIGA